MQQISPYLFIYLFIYSFIYSFISYIIYIRITAEFSSHPKKSFTVTFFWVNFHVFSVFLNRTYFEFS